MNGREQYADSTKDMPAVDLELIRLLTDQVADLTTDFDRLSFEEILALAPAILRSLLGVARLQISREHEQPAAMTLHRGEQLLANGSRIYTSYYIGPPEPIWFSVFGFSGEPNDALLLNLFFDRLLQALHTAGYSEELQRQARRSWLTGLHWGTRLEEVLQNLTPSLTPMVLLVLELHDRSKRQGSHEWQLQLRSFAQGLRLALTEEDDAYQLDNGLLAVLTPERELSRVESTVQRLSPSVRSAYAQSGEASGMGLLELAMNRLSGRSRRNVRVQARNLSGKVGQYPVEIHCGAGSAKTMLEQMTQDWHFVSPVSLVMDLPAGFALKALPKVSRPVLVITDGASRGYMDDLTDMEPDGLVFGTLDSSELRRQLERLANGERVYSGPILERSPLFPREREVWRLVAQGLDNADIAEQLGIGERTVANYFTSLKDKLHVATRCAVALSYWGKLRHDQ